VSVVPSIEAQANTPRCEEIEPPGRTGIPFPDGLHSALGRTYATQFKARFSKRSADLSSRSAAAGVVGRWCESVFG